MRAPLSEALRPRSLDELVGQSHLIEDKSFLKQIIETKKPISVLFWGPPGCGKTTLARIYGQSLSPNFHALSAVSTSVSDIKNIFKASEKSPLFNPLTVIFLDEIHRFNKSQQDLFLPLIESGQLILIGATTENPSFSLNNALLSRMRVFTLEALKNQDLEKLILRYENAFTPLNISKHAREFLIEIAHGDGRYLLSMIENIQLASPSQFLEVKDIKKILQKRSPLFDKGGDAHYNLISALHKSIRGSDPDAALYWLSRMFIGGEDPRYVGRRLIRIACEDIGLADPQALTYCLNAFKAYEILGSPEGEIALAQASLYLALAPKSNACYLGHKRSTAQAEETSHLPPPLHILNGATTLMKEIGYGKGYQYDPDAPDQFSGQNYFPEEIEERPHYYHPREIGFEREMKKRIEYFSQLRKSRLK